MGARARAARRRSRAKLEAMEGPPLLRGLRSRRAGGQRVHRLAVLPRPPRCRPPTPRGRHLIVVIPAPKDDRSMSLSRRKRRWLVALTIILILASAVSAAVLAEDEPPTHRVKRATIAHP